MLTREMIRDGAIQRMLTDSGHTAELLSEDELQTSRRRTLAEAPTDAVWVFGYGSLIWNPAFHYVERRIGTIHGYHRRFCLWTHLGRGSPERPGLVLGLEPGGSCRGVAFRVAPEEMDNELSIVWRREMVTGAYSPHWVTVDAGGERLKAITFVMNHAHLRYAGRLAEPQLVDVLSTASGQLGACADYLFNTVRHLEEMGVPDRPLGRLADQVARRLGRAGV